MSDCMDQVNKQLRDLHVRSMNLAGGNKSLSRLYPIMEAVGNPHKKLRVIHVAGTSGKTSTSYYIAALIRSSGKSVGLTVSPHVDSVTERVQVNGQPLPDEDFCRYMQEFLPMIEGLDQSPSYFEAMVCFAYWVFAKLELDYIVAETGMGGLVDATNIASRADKICVITDIGMDHMKVLGDNLTDITVNKAGIIYSGNRVFMIEQSDSVMGVVVERVQQMSAGLSVLPAQEVDSYIAQERSEAPEFQLRNWRLALEVIGYLSEENGLNISSALSPSDVAVPGRMETRLLDDGSTLIMDGGHNEQKVGAFVDSYRVIYGESKADVLLALKSGKEYKEVLAKLVPITGRLTITTFSENQDFPIFSQDPQEIADESIRLGMPTGVMESNIDAYRQLIERDSKIKLVIGSIYLLGRLRRQVP